MHKKNQTELNQQLRDELRKLDGRQHHEIVVRQKYEDSKHKLEKMNEAEMATKDKEIVKQLDQLLEEQQSILEQASVPFFSVTNQKESIQLQMGVLEMVQRVASELGVCNPAV